MTTSYNTIQDAQEAAPLFEVPFPLQTFTAIEYPGPVSTSAHSVEAALDAVGGLKHLSSTLAAEEPFRRVVELQLGHGIDRIHPIQGEIVPTQNLVLKITKRRKKKVHGGEASVVLPGANKGVYTAEVVGVVDKTVRFRSMADFQFVPDPKDPILQFSESLRKMDIEAIQSFRFNAPHESFSPNEPNAYPSIPPAIFSRISLPLPYGYKPNPISVPTTTINPITGEEHTRLINRDRYKGSGMTLINFGSKDPVPQQALPPAKKFLPVDDKVLEMTLKVLEERPIFTKIALLAYLPAEEAKRLNMIKYILPQCGYSFSDGPFKEMIIRFGYDPRVDESNRQYQRVMIRNLSNSQRKIKEQNTDPNAPPHTFDGKSVARNVGNFQLCDISDPELRELLDNPCWWTSDCNEKAGFYLPSFFAGFRELLRLKFIAIVNDTPESESHFSLAVSRLPTEDEADEERRHWQVENKLRQGTVEGEGGKVVKKPKALIPRTSVKPNARKGPGRPRKSVPIEPVQEAEEEEQQAEESDQGSPMEE